MENSNRNDPRFTGQRPDFAQQLQDLTGRVHGARMVANAIIEGQEAKKELVRMGKLHEVALRIAETRKSLEGEADKLSTRLDDLSKKAPAAFGHANALLDSHNADIDAMESELRQLSNLPLDK